MAGSRTTPLAPACTSCPARPGGFCAALDEAELPLPQDLRGARYNLPAGADLYRHGEVCGNFFNLLEGWAFSYVSLPDGRRQILDFAFPGAFLGLQPRPDAPMTHGVQCITPARVCAFGKHRLFELLDRQPRLMQRLCEIEICQEARACDHLVNIGQRPARERVAHLLLELFYRIRGTLPAAGERLALPLTHAHIGDAVGLTSVHVSRTLTALKDDGICALHQRVLSVQDPLRLVALSGFTAIEDLRIATGSSQPVRQPCAVRAG